MKLFGAIAKRVNRVLVYVILENPSYFRRDGVNLTMPYVFSGKIPTIILTKPERILSNKGYGYYSIFGTINLCNSLLHKFRWAIVGLKFQKSKEPK